jgi:redox-sensitive bicupin YhaK (pirin superfamily)
MSGPVTDADVPAEEEHPEPPTPPAVELVHGRAATVGGIGVRRTLPHRGRRTVGAWCFVDHFGPTEVDERGMAVGPHPHIGLATVTWLLEGAVLHRDSIGSLQEIHPGQLNVMHAGHGVVHAEEGVAGYRGGLHGVQLWLAQPEATRHGTPAFEHHAELPVVPLDHGRATVLMGSLHGATSPARTDTALVGADLELTPGASRLTLTTGFEHCVVVLDGSLLVDDVEVKPGELAYLGLGRDQITLDAAADTRALLLGGEPFEAELLMWWNFVGRTREEMDRAYDDWRREAERFPALDESPLARIPAPAPPWFNRPAEPR